MSPQPITKSALSTAMRCPSAASASPLKAQPLIDLGPSLKSDRSHNMLLKNDSGHGA